MEVRFNHDKNIAYLKLSGPATDKEILDLFDVAVADDRYRLGMGRLWDFRDADLAKLNAGTIAAMANHSMKYPSGINEGLCWQCRRHQCLCLLLDGRG
jgi:hypothetical protein